MVQAQTPSSPDFAPPRDGQRLHGSILTVDGWPLAGATVTILGPGGRQLARANSDDAGRYALTVAAAGPVTLVIASPGADPVARVVHLISGQAADLGVVHLGSKRRRFLPEPGLWVLDPAHTIVKAEARHLAMSVVEGRFTAFSGEIRVAEQVERSSVQVSIEAASIDTGNDERDAHLRSADFLDAERFPALTYRSERLVRHSDQRWRVEGWLTIRDITRSVPLDVTYLGTAPDPWGGTRIAATATTQITRRDYEMNWNMGLPGGLVLVGPTLRIHLDVQAVRQHEGP